MGQDDVDRSFAKLKADRQALVNALGLTEEKAKVAGQLATELMNHAHQLRKGHPSASVNRDEKVEIAALGIAAMVVSYSYDLRKA